MKGRTHELKTWPEPFMDVALGRKTFEVRKNDRDYRIGDTLKLMEYMPSEDHYTGMWQLVLVTYVLRSKQIANGNQFGIEPGYCIMSITRIGVDP